MTMTDFGGSFGNKSCATHAVKILALMLTGNSPTVSKVLPIRAPIAFVRPLACQSLSKDQRRLIYSLVILKNIIHPLVAGLIGYYIFNLSDMWLGALIVVSAMPTAMNNFVFSQRYNTFSAETSQLVFLSSVLSLFTLSALLWWFTAF